LRSGLDSAGQTEVVVDQQRRSACDEEAVVGACGPQDRAGQAGPAVVLQRLELILAVVVVDQDDGWTGLASPVLRTARTNDRFFVARTAALLIDHDLGLAATIEPAPQGDELNVTLKGGPLGISWAAGSSATTCLPLPASTRPGRSCAPCRSRMRSCKSSRSPNAQGACRCKLFHRYGNPLGKAALAYRCVKLGTTKAPLQVRVEDAVTMKPRRASRSGFLKRALPSIPRSASTPVPTASRRPGTPIRGSPM